MFLKKKSMFTIKAIQQVRESKTNIYPICMRLTVSRRTVYINTGIKIPEFHWDKQNRKVKSSCKNSMAMNVVLTKKYNEIEKVCIKQIRKGKTLTSRKIKEKLAGSKKRDECFFTYAEKWINIRKRKSVISVGTEARYKAVIEKLKTYTDQSLNIKAFNYNFLENYQVYLLEVLENCNNTINANFKALRAISKDMIRDGKMKSKKNPFNRYTFRNTPTKRKDLSIEEISKLSGLMLPKDSKQELCRNIFMFCYYTGFRISDSLNLKLSNIQGNYMLLNSVKNNTEINHPITDNARKLIDKYSKDKLDTDYLFGFLDSSKITDDKSLMLSIKRSTSLINKNLRIFSKRCELSQNISSHFARHSFAKNALQLGLSTEEVSSLMHHKSIQTTEIYTEIGANMREIASRKLEKL